MSIAIPGASVGTPVQPVYIPLKGGAWRTSRGVHAAWGEWVPALRRPVLAVATFDPETGEQRAQRTYELFPPDATGFFVNGAAGLEDGTLAVGYAWTGGASPSWGKLLIASLDDANRRIDVDLGRSESWRGVGDVTYDGEAFAVHGWEGGGSLLLARVSPAGQLVLPLTEYGRSGAGGFAEPEERNGGFTVTTSARDGHTFHYDPRSNRLLNGHTRAGAPLPWTPLTLPSGGLSATGADMAGSAADDAGGVWLSWEDLSADSTSRMGAVAHVGADGRVDRQFRYTSPPDDPLSPVSPIASRPGVLARGNVAVRLFATTWYRIYLYDYDGDRLGPPRILFQDRGVYRRIGCYLFIWNLGPFLWKDETWLSFIEERGGPSRVLRIVRVAEGCQYGTSSPLPETTCE